MMDCERYGANVFEVIDLINRDYPRGGIAQPGFTAGTCLRKDFTFSEERSAAPGMLLAVSRVNESVPLFLLEGVKRRLGSLANRRVAVLGLAFKADTDDERDSLAHKLIRLLERELADVVVHDPHVPTPTPSLRGGARRRGGGDRRRPTTPSSATRARSRAIAEHAAARLPGGRPVELLGRRPGVRLRLRARAPSARARMSRVLVTGGAGTIGAAVVRRLLADPAYEVRVSDQRSAPQWMREGCEVHTGDLRVPEQARAATRGCSARHPPRGDRRRDRQLPPAPAHADRGQQRALQRRDPRRARARGRALRVRVLLDGVRARRAVPDARGVPADCPDADLRLRLLQAHGRGLLPRGARRARPPVHDLPPVQRLRPGRGARRRAGHRPRGARPDRQGARRASARCRSSARASRRGRSPTSTTSPTGSSPR